MAKSKPTTLRDFDFDQDTLDFLISCAQANYPTDEHNYRDEDGTFRVGALVKFVEDYATHGVQKIIDLVADGYTFANDYPVSVSTAYPASYFIWYMRKPESMQAADLQAIADRVTAEYDAERKQRYEAHVAAVAQQSVERAERAAEKAAEAAKQKALAAAQAEALAVVGEFK